MGCKRGTRCGTRSSPTGFWWGWSPGRKLGTDCESRAVHLFQDEQTRQEPAFLCYWSCQILPALFSSWLANVSESGLSILSKAVHRACSSKGSVRLKAHWAVKYFGCTFILASNFHDHFPSTFKVRVFAFAKLSCAENTLEPSVSPGQNM